MASEFGSPIALESLPYTVARAVDPEDAPFVDKQVSMEVLTRADGVMLALFTTKWRLQGFAEDNPDIRFSSLVAADD
jgi:peptide chain release factor 3